MATMLPQQQPPSSRPSHDFAPSSPPDRALFQQPQQPGETANGPHVQYQSSIEFRRNVGPAFPNGNGSVPPPHGPHHIPTGGSRHRGTMSAGGFEGGKSPPSTKNTSHVPCKFFRTGQCQAGPACPFSHSTDVSTVDTPCKYFAKGNCKFGSKCALAHILPNGRVVNRPNGAMRGNMNFGPSAPRIDPQLYQQSDPLLAQSLLAQQGIPTPFTHPFPAFAENDPTLQDNLTPRPFDHISQQDGYALHPDSKYGSPREESRFTSFSPNGRLNVLDAPLPGSWDSQGISNYAKIGHAAASLPSKFGLLESSPPGSIPQKSHIPLDSIRNLQAPSLAGMESRYRREDLGSSPLGSGDEGFGQRFMHSRRIPKTKMLSTSMPRVDPHIDDSDSDFQFSGGEEDYIPTLLHDQIFTRDEQQRRHSRTEQDRKNIRDSLSMSGIGTPANSSSQVGSPSTGSPSRYGGLFARQQQQDTNPNMAGSPSAFGHVGSPLRKSSLHSGASPSMRPSIAGDMSPNFPSLSSPPRQSSMSALSQQLSRTRLSTKPSESNETSTSNTKTLYPTSSARHSSAPTNHLNRAVSTSSMGRNTDRIEEEQDTVFNMEEDFDEQRKRNSGHATWGNPGKASPRLGPIGTGRGSGDFS